MAGIIDWDTAAPSNRIWDLAYAAYQFVPFHPPDGLEPFGRPEEPDRRKRLKLFTDAYGHAVTPSEVLDAAVMRIYGTGTHIAPRGRPQEPRLRGARALRAGGRLLRRRRVRC
ncbi:hypothetical protein [Streptomyces sp. NPDC002845]